MTESTRVRFYTTPIVAKSENLQRFLANIGGGFTITPGIGGWMDDDDRLITEPSATIEVILTGPDNGRLEKLTNYVKWFAWKAQESAVLRTVDTIQAEMLDTRGRQS